MTPAEASEAARGVSVWPARSRGVGAALLAVTLGLGAPEGAWGRAEEAPP